MLDTAIKIIEPVGKALIKAHRYVYPKVEEVVKPANIQHYQTPQKGDGDDNPSGRLAA